MKAATVRLRLLREKDATRQYARWFCEEELRRWIARPTATVAACRSYIATQRNDPDVFFWGIFFDGHHVGNIKARRVRGVPGIPDQAVLGLMIGEREKRGMGVGPAAIRLAARQCRRRWKVGMVAAGVHPLNVRSVRAFEKCGFGLSPDTATQIWLEKKL